jgi:hypothetical protein
MLKSAHAPLLIPPLINKSLIDTTRQKQNQTSDTPPTDTPTSDGEDVAQAVISQLADDLLDAKDSLTAAKINHGHHANKDCALDPVFDLGDWVLLATAH